MSILTDIQQNRILDLMTEGQGYTIDQLLPDLNISYIRVATLLSQMARSRYVECIKDGSGALTEYYWYRI